MKFKGMNSKGIIYRALYALLNLIPCEVIADYAMEELDMHDHDAWMDMMAERGRP